MCLLSFYRSLDHGLLSQHQVLQCCDRFFDAVKSDILDVQLLFIVRVCLENNQNVKLQVAPMVTRTFYLCQFSELFAQVETMCDLLW